MTLSATQSILMVDDDGHLLDGFRRHYHRTLDLTTAPGGEEGLVALREQGPFAVVVSDYQMPGMNGVAFLRKVREVAPETVRIMLTGNADLQSAVDAVNDGNVFRFLTKPCTPVAFQAAVQAGLEQYQLRFAERQLLDGTLKGSLEVMVELLSLANPGAFGRASRVRRYVASMVTSLGLADRWRYEAAAMLSQIGCVAIPPDVIDRVARGEQLTPDQERMVDRHPEIARDLIGRIPRLAGVAEMIARQSGEAADQASDPVVRLGARILACALEFDELVSVGATREQAVDSVRRNHGHWEPALTEALAGIELVDTKATLEKLPVRRLRVGMVLHADVVNSGGMVLMTKGHRLNAGTLERLRNYAHLGNVVEPVHVLVPKGDGAHEVAA